MTGYAIPGNWAEHAACLHSVNVMTMHGTTPDPRAITTCTGCPVLTECRTWAMTTPDPADYMVAGGLTPGDRALRRRIDLAAPFARLVLEIDEALHHHRKDVA